MAIQAPPIDAPLDPERLRAWIGRRGEAHDRIDPWHVAAMHATLDGDGAPPLAGEPLPAAWHWLFFREAEPARGLGADGHPALGGFLPPVPQARRMWAGGRLVFKAPLEVDAAATRTSTITDIACKRGRSGPLVFVTVAHEIVADGVPAISEVHDIVYRAGVPAKAASAPTPAGAPPIADPLWTRTLTPDPVLLFRYSALTFNGHRIHYDGDYARTAEGYPGLVVHGPLVATLLLDLIRRNRPDARIATFAYRAAAPLFCGEALTLAAGVDPAHADGLILAATGPDGRQIMTAEAQLRGAV